MAKIKQSEIFWVQRARPDQWLRLKLVEMPNYSSRAKDQEEKEKWVEPLMCSAQVEQHQCKQSQRMHSYRVSSLRQELWRVQEQATEARRQDKSLLSRSSCPRFLTVTVWGAAMKLWNGGWCQVRRPGEEPDLQKAETVFQSESIAKALRSWLTHHFIGREKWLWPVSREQRGNLLENVWWQIEILMEQSRFKHTKMKSAGNGGPDLRHAPAPLRTWCFCELCLTPAIFKTKMQPYVFERHRLLPFVTIQPFQTSRNRYLTYIHTSCHLQL